MQKKFLQKTVLQDIEDVKNKANNNLSQTDIEKIKYYYGNAVASVLGEGYCMLRGSAMNDAERTVLTYLGSLTGLVDDFFDKNNLSQKHIRAMMDNPYQVATHSIQEKLVVQFWKKVIDNSPYADLIKSCSNQVFAAQILSQKQTESNITADEIKNITFQKGASSIIFYRSVFGEITDDAELKMLTALGNIGQLENDIFDVYKDWQEGIFTLVTTTKKINNIRKIYKDLNDQIIYHARRTKYLHKNITGFLRFVAAITSRGFVCLDFLEQQEKSTNGIFVLKNYIRSQLVCDMEKPKNILRSIHYYAKVKSD